MKPMLPQANCVSTCARSNCCRCSRISANSSTSRSPAARSPRREPQPEPGERGVRRRLQGDLTLGNFHTVDKANSADFLKWKSFYFGNVDVKTQPLSIAVGEVAPPISLPGRSIISPEGS